MSVAKARSISHLKACLLYAMGKAGAEEICRQNLAGEDANELCAEYQIVQGLNDRCVNNTIRIEISPTITDGEKLSLSDWGEIVQSFMQRMGLAERQYIAILHTDRAHKHAHVLCNRIDFHGVAYNDSNVSRKAGQIMEQIAIERGMTTAMAVHHEKQRALEPLRKQILAAHRAVVRPGLTPLKYQALMQQQGVAVVFNQSKSTGRITGMSFCVSDTKIKASVVDRNLSYNKLFGVKREATKSIKITPRQLLTRTRPSVGSILPSGSISMQLAKMFGRGIVQYAKPEEKEKEEELTL